jgi:nucleoside-diphosphate-sugar epimerase
MISINDLARAIIQISRRNIGIRNIPGPEGVRGRNSDNRLIEEKLGWAPRQPLRKGLELTYHWIKEQTNAKASTAG